MARALLGVDAGEGRRSRLVRCRRHPQGCRFIATNGACAAPFGVSNDQKRNGVAAYQSIFNMLAITGNYENPGGNTIAYDPWGTVMSYVAGWDEGVLTPEMKA